MPSVESNSSGSKSSATASPAASEASCNSTYTKSIGQHDNCLSVIASTCVSDSSATSIQSLALDVRFVHQPPQPGASQTLDLLMVGAQLEQFHVVDPHVVFGELTMLESVFEFEPRVVQKNPHVRHLTGSLSEIVLFGVDLDSLALS